MSRKTWAASSPSFFEPRRRRRDSDPAQPLSRPAVGADVDLEPVPDEPALMADDILVVADLHIGIEEELHEKGIRVPSRAEVMGRKLVDLADRRGASRLVILGDVKHLVPKMASRERRDVYVFFRDLAPRFREVYIAQGNHDGMLKNIVPRSVRFKPAYGFRIEDVRARFIGPLFDEDLVRVEDASVHLLDGTNLGRLRDIRVDLGFRPEDYRQ